MNAIIVKLDNVISYNNIHIEVICQYVNNEFLGRMSEGEALYFRYIKERYAKLKDVIGKDDNISIHKYMNAIMDFINIKEDHREAYDLFNLEKIRESHAIIQPLCEKYGVTISGLFQSLNLMNIIHENVSGNKLVYILYGDDLVTRDMFVKFCPENYSYKLISSTDELPAGRYIHYHQKGEELLTLDKVDGFIKNEEVSDIWL